MSRLVNVGKRVDDDLPIEGEGSQVVPPPKAHEVT